LASVKQNIEAVSTKMEIEENIEVQKKGWVIQRIGWLLMLIFVLLAAFGFFGDGVVSKKNLQAGEQKFEYPQYSRFESRMELKFDLHSAAQQNIISLPGDYLDQFRIESILPEPKENTIANDRVNYVFEGNGPMKITFYLVPQNLGRLDADVLVNDQKFNFNHFIYP
jgi:hypothetical protein